MTGGSIEVFREIRFAAKPTNGPQVPHLRDEFYVVPGPHITEWRTR
jgi:hypothetical protein